MVITAGVSVSKMRSTTASGAAPTLLELIVVPVSDVDRAKAFYAETLGFRLDVDHNAGDAFRVVQLTPPGSACSITIGVNVGAGEPGTTKGLHLIVDDIEAAPAHLRAGGVENSGVQHFVDGQVAPGPEPEGRDYGSFIFFSDPTATRGQSSRSSGAFADGRAGVGCTASCGQGVTPCSAKAPSGSTS
jgi:catechol 2,3-dioxygenase-like lactoylglutathione lyase family enzyme